MNQPLRRAHALGSCATWRCVCQNPIALQGRSGSSAGPTPDTVVRCERCGRVYFVIPDDRSQGPPIEVVELFGLPPPEASASDSSADAEHPTQAGA